MIAVLLGLSLVVLAQVLEFDDTILPPPRELKVLHSLYVYGKDYRNNLSGSELNYENVVITDEGSDQVAKAPHGYQLVFMNEKTFNAAIDPDSFCCTARDVKVNHIIDQCRQEHGIVFRNKPYVERHGFYLSTQSGNARITVGESAVYNLVAMNCGTSRGAKFSGKVNLRSPYGYLPGLDYPKKNFYFGLCALYGVLIIVWFGTCFRCRKLLPTHHCISAIMALGFAECGFWFAYLANWNTTGSQMKELLVAALIFTIAKRIFSYILLLVASLGWNSIKSALGKKTVMALKAIFILCLVFDVLHHNAISFTRIDLDQSILLLAFSLLPGIALNGSILFLVFKAQEKLTQSLKLQKTPEKFALLQKFITALILGLTIEIGTQIYETIALLKINHHLWLKQWVASDALGHFLLLGMLLFMGYFWVPREHLIRSAYQAHISREYEYDIENFSLDQSESSDDLSGDLDSLTELTQRQPTHI